MPSSRVRRPIVCLDGYVRVSAVRGRRGERFISPTVQREAIEEWAYRQGVRLNDVFEELDQSGARADRPQLQLAIARIEAGASDGLVVWRVDRFGRSLVDGVNHIERIRAAGGQFHSVHDGLDINTEAGRLVLRILLSVAEYQLDGLRASWDAAVERAVRRGVWPRHGTMPGYRRTRAGRLRPDPRTAPIITDLFRRRARGESLLTLATLLEENKVLTGLGNPGWSTGTVYRLLQSRVYLGEVYFGTYVNTKAHPPLIDPATWEAARYPSRLILTNKNPPVLLVNGLARCAGCGYALHTLHSPRRNGSVDRLYRCTVRHASGHCQAPAAIKADKLESYIVSTMFRMLAARRTAPLAKTEAAEAKASAAALALSRYRDNDRIIDVIGEQAFIDGLAVRQRKLADCNLDLAGARSRLGMHQLPPTAEIRASWDAMPLEQQRDVLAQVIDTSFLLRGRGAANERVIICPAGTAPRHLPRVGYTGRMKPIQPRRGWVNPREQTPNSRTIVSPAATPA